MAEADRKSEFSGESQEEEDFGTEDQKETGTEAEAAWCSQVAKASATDEDNEEATECGGMPVAEAERMSEFSGESHEVKDGSIDDEKDNTTKAEATGTPQHAETAVNVQGADRASMVNADVNSSSEQTPKTRRLREHTSNESQDGKPLKKLGKLQERSDPMQLAASGPDADRKNEQTTVTAHPEDGDSWAAAIKAQIDRCLRDGDWPGAQAGLTQLQNNRSRQSRQLRGHSSNESYEDASRKKQANNDPASHRSRVARPLLGHSNHGLIQQLAPSGSAPSLGQGADTMLDESAQRIDKMSAEMMEMASIGDFPTLQQSRRRLGRSARQRPVMMA